MRFFLFLILPYFAVLPGTTFAQPLGAAKTRIAVCIPPQAELVRRLMGTGVSVDVLLPSGSNHETYEPTFGQLQKISQAFVFIKVGHPAFNLESLLLEKLGTLNGALRIVSGAENVDLNSHDIHYWTSPRRLVQSVSGVSRILKNLFPSEKAEIEMNEQNLLRELKALDEELRALFVPFQGRKFLVSHPAWGYLAEDYGLQQLAVENEGKEPGVLRADELLRQATAAQIKTIFIEPGSSQESVHFFADKLKAKVETLNPLAADWIENLRRSSQLIAESFRVK